MKEVIMYDSVHRSKALIQYISNQPVKPELKRLPDGYLYFVIIHEDNNNIGYT